MLRVTGGRPVSKKVLSQALGHLIGLGTGYVLSRNAIHLSPTGSAEVAAGISVVSGLLAGYIAKEEGLR